MALTASAPTPRWPIDGYPTSLAALRRALGRSPLYNILGKNQTQDMFHAVDDFWGDTINLDLYAVANGGGASVASFATQVLEDGWIRATTGTAADDTASASLIGPAIYFGARNPGIEIRFRPVTAVTEARIEMGLIDVVPGSNKSAINSLTTPTVNTSVVEAALYVYNHTGSTTTNELVTIGSAVAAQKSTFTPPTAITAATAYTMRLQVDSLGVLLWMDGKLVATLASGIAGTVGLCPWVRVSASNATSKSVELDYIETWKQRNR
jgi:hypothetical protein